MTKVIRITTEVLIFDAEGKYEVDSDFEAITTTIPFDAEKEVGSVYKEAEGIAECIHRISEAGS